MKTKPYIKSKLALTFIEVLLVIAVIVILAAILLPALAKAKSKHARINCTNNLKQVSLAFRQWALDNKGKFPMQVSITNCGAMEWAEAGLVFPQFMVMSNELNTPKILYCSQEKNPLRESANVFTIGASSGYMQTPLSTNNVSYFIGVDADETRPNDFLIGDDNFTVNGKRPAPGLLNLWTNSPVAWTKQRHVKRGNIGLADGSVQGLSSAKLPEYLVQTGSATNRLAMP